MQTQMAFTMYEATLGNLFMPVVFVSFGLMLGFVTLLLALSFVFKKNAKYTRFGIYAASVDQPPRG